MPQQAQGKRDERDCAPKKNRMNAAAASAAIPAAMVFQPPCALRAAGYRLDAHEMGYAHPGCMAKAQRAALTGGRS